MVNKVEKIIKIDAKIVAIYFIIALVEKIDYYLSAGYNDFTNFYTYLFYGYLIFIHLLVIIPLWYLGFKHTSNL